MEKNFYLDNAATTKVFDEIFDLVKQNNDDCFYNPSAAYRQGLSSRKVLESARKEICEMLHGDGGQLYFTSSATESNNTVFFGAHLRQGQTVLISAGEHPSVFNSANALQKRGIKVLEIPLKQNGVVDEERLKELLVAEPVCLVSIIHISNETGQVNDIKSLVKIAKQIRPEVIFHSDGVQAVGKVEVNLSDLGVDLYTFSSHKLNAPRGIAGLWVKRGISLNPLLFGGGQEFGLRSSTENVAGAIALCFALKKSLKSLDENYEKVSKLNRALRDKLLALEISKYIKFNSDENCSPYILSVSFDGIKGEVLMNLLETDGILISTGSACSAKKAGNRVLGAMGKSEREIVGSVRISFSAYDDYDLDYIVSSFDKNVKRLEANVKR